MLFYKIDRAARNLKDLVMLVEIEKDYSLPFISVTQPVDNTPTGRMVRRTLATIGAFPTVQQSLDIQEGIAKRVALGWFPNRCPYRNLRLNGRAIAEVHPNDAGPDRWPNAPTSARSRLTPSPTLRPSWYRVSYSSAASSGGPRSRRSVTRHTT